MNPFVIPLNDWAAGERKFHSQAGLEFFQTFDNTDILDACVNVEAVVRKEGVRKVKVTLPLHPGAQCFPREPIRVPGSGRREP